MGPTDVTELKLRSAIKESESSVQAKIDAILKLMQADLADLKSNISNDQSTLKLNNAAE